MTGSCKRAGAWLRLFVLGLAGSAGISSVSIRSSGSAAPWQPMTNKFGASWESYSQPPQPSDLLVATDDGQSAVLAGIITAGASGIVDSSVQLSTNPSSWATVVYATDFNPAVQPGSTAVSVVSVPLGPGAQVESQQCCDSCFDINFSGAVYSCADQKRFGHCNATYLTEPVKLQDATLEGLDRTQGYCSRSCNRCQCRSV